MSAPPEINPPRLGAVDVDVLESLYQHRLLSTRQVRELHMPDSWLRTAQRVLARLHAAQLANRAREPGGLSLWYLTARGAEAAETLPTRAEMRRKVVRPEQAAGPLRHHTVAVNDVGIAFVRAARQRGHECGPLAWRHEIAHRLAPTAGRRKPEQLIADAVLTYQLVQRGGHVSFHYRFLELDRATMPVDDLAAKVSRYARLYRQLVPSEDPGAEPVALWTHLYPVFPTVMVVLGREARNRLERRRETVMALCQQDPDLQDAPEVEVSVCLLEDLIEHGPFASIFQTTSDPDVPTNWLGEKATR